MRKASQSTNGRCPICFSLSLRIKEVFFARQEVFFARQRQAKAYWTSQFMLRSRFIERGRNKPWHKPSQKQILKRASAPLMEIIFGFPLSRPISVAEQFGIADLLKEIP